MSINNTHWQHRHLQHVWSISMDGPTPNPLPPNTSSATLLLVVLWITLGPALTLTCTRLYTKLRIKHQIHWDDYLICIASVWLSIDCSGFVGCNTQTETDNIKALSVCGAALNHLQVKNGFGRHIYYLTDDQISQVIKWSTLVEMVNEIAVFFVKTSICLFILRMLSRTYRIVRFLVWATIAIFFVITAVAVITLAVQCTPFQGVWDKSLHPKCISSKVVTQITRAYGGRSERFQCRGLLTIRRSTECDNRLHDSQRTHFHPAELTDEPAHQNWTLYYRGSWFYVCN